MRRGLNTYRIVLRDPRTPWLPKLILAFAVAYAVSPIDIIPDCIPVLGHLDDLLIVPGLVWVALRMIPENVVVEAKAEARKVANHAEE